MTPRQQHEHAQKREQIAQQRLYEARRELSRQRRELDVALPYDYQADERTRRLEPAREVFRQRFDQLEQARRERESLFDAIPDKTDEDGGNYWAWQGQRQLPAQAR